MLTQTFKLIGPGDVKGEIAFTLDPLHPSLQSEAFRRTLNGACTDGRSLTIEYNEYKYTGLYVTEVRTDSK